MRLALAALVLVPACAAPAPRAGSRPEPEAADLDDEWHREPVVGRAASEHVLVLDHADPSFRCEAIAEALERQYGFLRDTLGFGPDWIVCHVGSRYPSGFAMCAGDQPEMFLRAGSVFDSQADYAHEMMHCFLFRFGALPHWFGESMSDLAFADSEIALWGRRHEAEFLDSFDRVDHRSYELLALRRRHGSALLGRIGGALEARRERCRRTFVPGAPLEEQNLLLLEVLSAACGEDVRPLFESEFGFNPRTRERQRGY